MAENLPSYLPSFFISASFVRSISTSSFSVSISDTCTLPCGSRSSISWLAMPAGRDCIRPASLAGSLEMINAFFSVMEDILASSASWSASESLSALMSSFISGINSISPSGTSTTPKFLPALARLAISWARLSTTWPSVIFLARTSSPINTALGWVLKATSSVMCEALLPIRRTKCQYLRAELTSRQMLPTSSA